MNVGIFIGILLGLGVAISIQVALPSVVVNVLLTKRRQTRKKNWNEDVLSTTSFVEKLQDNNDTDQWRDTNRLYFTVVSIVSSVFLIIWICIFISGIVFVSQPKPSSLALLNEYGIHIGIGIINLMFSVTGIIYAIFHFVLEHFQSDDKDFVEMLPYEPTVLETITDFINTEPIITFTVTCWHFESKDSLFSPCNIERGDTEPELVKVVDYVESEVFKFKRCVDNSTKHTHLELFPESWIKANINHVVLFGDQKTKDCFNKQRFEFYHRIASQRKWLNQELTTEINIPGQRKTVFSNWKTKIFSVWFSKKFYWLCLTTGTKWFFKIIFKLKVNNIDFQIRKTIYSE